MAKKLDFRILKWNYFVAVSSPHFEAALPPQDNQIQPWES